MAGAREQIEFGRLVEKQVIQHITKEELGSGPKKVFFDVDGVLANSSASDLKVHQVRLGLSEEQALESRNQYFSNQRTPHYDMETWLKKALDTANWNAYMMRATPKPVVYEGMLSAVARLRQLDVSCGIITSGTVMYVNQLLYERLKCIGIVLGASNFDEVVHNEESEASKAIEALFDLGIYCVDGRTMVGGFAQQYTSQNGLFLSNKLTTFRHVAVTNTQDSSQVLYIGDTISDYKTLVEPNGVEPNNFVPVGYGGIHDFNDWVASNLVDPSDVIVDPEQLEFRLLQKLGF